MSIKLSSWTQFTSSIITPRFEVVTTIQNYTYSTWKQRNDVLHNDKVKSKKTHKRHKLQERIEVLYGRGHANLNGRELKYFKLPVEQRKKKDTKAMML